MIVDSLSKTEVMSTIYEDFKNEILPYYCNIIRPKLYYSIRVRAQRERSVISLGWERIESQNKIKFEILKRGDSECDMPLFVSYFRYKGQNCYAVCVADRVVVYQGHSLQRYAERVIGCFVSNIDVFKKYILKNINSTFKIVLPSPTHRLCVYSAIAESLMLGDYDDEIGDNNWYNTCISLKETHNTQSKILQTLSIMQRFINKVGFDPAKSINVKRTSKYLSSAKQSQITDITQYLKYSYMLYMLHLSFKLDITNRFTSEIDVEMGHIKNQLSELSVSVNELSPYDNINGIATKGELDFRKD